MNYKFIYNIGTPLPYDNFLLKKDLKGTKKYSTIGGIENNLTQNWNIYPFEDKYFPTWAIWNNSNRETLSNYINDFKNNILIPLRLKQLNSRVKVIISLQVKYKYNNLELSSFEKNLTQVNILNNWIYLNRLEDKLNELTIEALYNINNLINSSNVEYFQEIFIKYKIENIEIDQIQQDLNKRDLLVKLSHRGIDITHYHLTKTMDLSLWSNNIHFSRKYDFAHYLEDGILHRFDIKNNFYTCIISSQSHGGNNVFCEFKDQLQLQDRNKLIENKIKLPSLFKGNLKDININYDNFIRTFYYSDKNNLQQIDKIIYYENGIITWKEDHKHSQNRKFIVNTKSNNINNKVIKRLTNNLLIGNNTNGNNDKKSYSTFISKGHNKDKDKINIITAYFNSRKLSNHKLEIISAGYFDGTDSYTFYLKDYLNLNKNAEDILFDFIHSLIQPKYHKYNIYLHNQSGFDSVFLLQPVTRLLIDKGINDEISILPIIRDGKIIMLNIIKTYYDSSGKKKTINIKFYDSYLLLPKSLKSLTETFLLPGELESHFKEHIQADLNNNSLFNNGKYGLLQYNINDCIALYQVLIKFNELCIKLFNLNIWDKPTLSSLAFELYKKKFMLKNTIAMTRLEEYHQMKHAYYEGAVDVYKAHGYNLKYYEINSLYPFVLQNNLFPIKGCILFQGNKPLKDIFGIVQAKILTLPYNTNYLFVPILPKKINGNTLTPLGQWIGWYCSEELKYAESIGYKIEVIKGYHWPYKKPIFKNYIDKIYHKKLSYDNSDSKNTICDLLLNSLYGRFGVNPIQLNYTLFTESQINSKEYLDFTKDKHSILKFEFDSQIGNVNMEMIDPEIYDISINKGEYQKLMEISTPLSIFTTSYARILMHKYKLKYQNNLYYSDTNSLILDSYLPVEDVGHNMGQFKLEYDNIEGIFLAPKLYGLIDKDRKSIKTKGITEILSFDRLKSLLNPENRKIKILDETNINMKNILFTLSFIDNKRKITFKDDIFKYTKPYIIDNDKIIN